jgi:hypothetical protein
MREGEFEVRNRHGDVVQRGAAEVTDVHETVDGRALRVEFDEPMRLRRGDSFAAIVDMHDV